MRKPGALVAVLVTAALIGAGCSDDDIEAGTVDDSENQAEEQTPQGNGNGGTDETPDEPDPTEPREEQAPQDEEKLDPQTAAAAEDFIVEFMDAYDRAEQTGDTAEVEALYTDECERCGRNIRNIQDIYGDGGRIEGGSWTDPQPEAQAQEDTGNIRVAVPVTVEAYTVVDGTGNEVGSEDQENVNETFWASQTDDGWRVVHWLDTD